MLPPAAAACDLAKEVNTVGAAEQFGPVLLLLLLEQPEIHHSSQCCVVCWP